MSGLGRISCSGNVPRCVLRPRKPVTWFVALVLLVKISQDLVAVRVCGNVSSLQVFFKLHFLLHSTVNPSYLEVDVRFLDV